MLKINKQLKLSFLFLVVLVLMLLWMQGVFRSRVGPGEVQLKGVPSQGQTHAVSRQKVLDWQEAPG